MPPIHTQQSLFAELERDINKTDPKDLMQFCSDWFQDKLRAERHTATSNTSNNNTASSSSRSIPSVASPTKPSSARNKLANFPAISLPTAGGGDGFSMHGAHPSPFSEQGSTNSPFGPPGGGVSATSALAQRRSTMAALGGSGVGPLGGAAAFGAGGAGSTPGPRHSALSHLAEETDGDEDDEDGQGDDDNRQPIAPSSMARGSVPAISFASFSFSGNPGEGLPDEPSPVEERDSPFRGGGGGPPPASSSGAAYAAGGDGLIPPSYALGRRTSVSAESLVPTHQSFAAKFASGSLTSPDTTPKNNETLYSEPKSASQLARIKQSIANNFLFRNLDEEQEKDVLAAMREMSIQSGEVVIEQGAAGDFFYVVENGEFDIFVKKGEGEFEGASDDLERKWGKKVHTATPGGSFGELALMYNAPRSATVIAKGPATLWALDRISFRTILLDHTSRKRRMYENFLATVPILSSLEPHERAKIADSLEARVYAPGEVVVNQGEAGEEFYLIESGVAVVEKEGMGVVGELSKGDYFGELALLNREPRAATVRALSNDGSKLRVAALGEKAFTRLLGPVREIMARTAGERYGRVGR